MTIALDGPRKILRRAGAHASPLEPDMDDLSLFESRDGPVQINDRVEWSGTDCVRYVGTVIDRRGDLAYIAVLGIPHLFIAGIVAEAAHA